jgi:hypothetical protein
MFKNVMSAESMSPDTMANLFPKERSEEKVKKF